MNNTIIRPSNEDQPEDIPLKLDMTVENGLVTMRFEPPVVRMRLAPREARVLAMGLLQHAERALEEKVS